jgi:putative acetyltransferase
MRNAHLKIRPEIPAEFEMIRALVKAAFATARHADGDEHEYVDRLRASRAYIPELALVAEDGGGLVGHIMLTRILVSGAQGARPALLLSPLAVAPDRQNQGIGSLLARESLARATASGAGVVLVVGDPAYYERFGFRSSAALGIRNVDGFDERNVMALELRPGALAKCLGTVSFPA